MNIITGYNIISKNYKDIYEKIISQWKEINITA